MKTYIVYVNGNDCGMMKAGSHNAAEKRAKKTFGPSRDTITSYLHVHPWMSEEEAIKRLTSHISVAYTEV